MCSACLIVAHLNDWRRKQDYWKYGDFSVVFTLTTFRTKKKKKRASLIEYHNVLSLQET